jgi:hypothetical protein
MRRGGSGPIDDERDFDHAQGPAGLRVEQLGAERHVSEALGDGDEVEEAATEPP